MDKKLYFFIGVTGELIKHAPVIKELQRRKIPFKIITSGQNKVNFASLEGFIGILKPDIAFPEKVNKSSVVHFLYWAIKVLFRARFLLSNEFKNLDKKETFIIIQGDTVSSTLGAIITKIYGLKLAHIESGDLSFNLLEPFPEELCRSINIRLADVLFAPNKWAKNNLKFVRGVKVNTNYNSLLESFYWAIKNRSSPKFVKKLKKYYLLIMRRQEHVIFRRSWSKKMMEFIIKNSSPALNCVILENPLVEIILKSLQKDFDSKTIDKIKIIPGQTYINFMKLMKNAEFIATDSCTNQLEAYFLGKPYLGLRNLTEQIEGLNKNVVIAKSNKKIMKNFLVNYQKYKTKPVTTKVRPSKIIVDYLLKR